MYRYTNASSVAEKFLLAYDLRSSCSLPFSHSSSTRERDPGNGHGKIIKSENPKLKKY